MTHGLFVVVAASATLLSAGGARSAVDRGEIAFSADLEEAQIYTMRPDGTDRRVLTLEAQASDDPAESPNGKRLAFSSARSGQWEIYVQPTLGGPPRNLSRNPAPDFEPAWSPDGRWIAFTSKRSGKYELYRMRADGTHITRLTRSLIGAELPAWSPNGRLIAFDRARDKDHSDVYIVGASGGKPLRLTRNGFDNWCPRWSPNGRKIAYTETHLLKSGEWPSGIRVMNADGRGKQTVTKPGGESKRGIQRDSFPTWSPDGKRLAFWRTRGDAGLWIVNADGSHARMIAGTDSYDGHGLRWSKRGRLLWSAETIGLEPIVALPASGGRRRAVTDGREEDLQPRWAPDGRMIAFDRFLGEGRSDEIFVADANGKNMRDLTNDPASDEQPAWSPDGTRIVFASNRNQETSLVDLYVMRTDGSEVHALVSDPLNDAEPEWSPDGARIAFARFPRDSGDSAEIPGDIYSVATDGSGEQRLTSNPANDEEPRWSPDGRTIAFFSTRDGRPQLYLMNADGTQQRKLLASNADDREPSWSPDGESLVFSRYTKTRVEVWWVQRDGTGAHRIAIACANTYQDSPSDLCMDHPPSPTWRSGGAG